MVKVIKTSGFTREPGWLTHNGKRYRFLTVGSDKKSVMDYVESFNPDIRKKIIIANEDLSHYTVYGRKNPSLSQVRVTAVKTPVKIDDVKNLTRFRYGGKEFQNVFGMNTLARTSRGTNYATTQKQARDDIGYYLNTLLPSDRHGVHKPYNDYLIVRFIDNQYVAFAPVK